jgi:hypothetical protein
MADISTVRTDLLSIVGNNRMPIKTKRILIKRGLKAINTFIDLEPNKIYNQKKRKINKILLMLPSIKYNVDLKKLLTKELITDITDFESYPDIVFNKTEDDTKGKEYEKTFENCLKKIYLSNDVDKSNFKELIKNALPNKEILIGTTQVESEDSEDTEVESVESEKSNESLNSDSDTEDETDEISDDEDSNNNSDDDGSDSDTEELDNTVNNLVEDLADDAKAKLIIKMTKYKLEHVFKMEAEKNRNMERMEELTIKKLKINNKYKLKKLENRK